MKKEINQNEPMTPNDYIGDNWYIVNEETLKTSTEKAFYNRKEAEEYFNQQCLYAEGHYKDEGEYTCHHSKSQNSYYVQYYYPREDSELIAYHLQLVSFSNYLKILIHRWMKDIIFHEMDINTGNPYPYLVHLILFDGSGLNEQLFDNSERPFIEWVKVLFASDPRKLHSIAYEVAQAFLDDCGYYNSTRHSVDYANNEYISHIGEPMGSIHILYRDAFGPDNEERKILKLLEEKKDEANSEEESDIKDDLPF